MAIVPSTPLKPLSGNADVDAILDGGYGWVGGRSPTGQTIITINFVGPIGAIEPDATKFWEDSAFFSAIIAWEHVANIDFRHVEFADRETADILLKTGTPAQYPILLKPDGQVALGTTNPPYQVQAAHQSSGQYQAVGYFNNGNIFGEGWTEDGLNKGGYGYWTMIHELGHALGLFHPFALSRSNNGNAPFPTTVALAKMNSSLKYEDDGLLTIESYHLGILANGWYDITVDSRYSSVSNGLPNLRFGYFGGPSVIDIAAIQWLYGANETYKAGNDVYEMPNGFSSGTFWSTIWDTGGIDEIRYSGTGASRISLRSFSVRTPVSASRGVLDFISEAKFVNGGFIIADDFTNALGDAFDGTGAIIESGVIIENATGGDGNDTILGNGVANTLKGNKGRDTLDGDAGADTLEGGLGDDIYVIDNLGDKIVEAAGEGTDLAQSSVSFTLSANVENLTLTGVGSITGIGNEQDNTIIGNAGKNTLEGGAGNDTLNGKANLDTASYTLAAGAVTVALVAGAQNTGGAGTDTLIGIENLTGSRMADRLTGNDHANVLKGGSGDDTLIGAGGNDSLFGAADADTLIGGLGGDELTGGAGNDIFKYKSVGESDLTAETRDLITDFQTGDKIDLSTIDANTVAAGNQAFAFVSALAFSGVAGQLRSVAGGAITTVSGDVNGDRKADFSIHLTGAFTLSAVHFIL